MLSKAVTFKKWEVGSEQDELEDYSHLPLGESFRVTEQGGETQSEPGAEGSKLEVPQRQDGRRSQHLRDRDRCLGRNATDLPGALSRILLTATDQGAPVRNLPETWGEIPEGLKGTASGVPKGQETMPAPKRYSNKHKSEGISASAKKGSRLRKTCSSSKASKKDLQVTKPLPGSKL